MPWYLSKLILVKFLVLLCWTCCRISGLSETFACLSQVPCTHRTNTTNESFSTHFMCCCSGSVAKVLPCLKILTISWWWRIMSSSPLPVLASCFLKWLDIYHKFDCTILLLWCGFSRISFAISAQIINYFIFHFLSLCHNRRSILQKQLHSTDSGNRQIYAESQFSSQRHCLCPTALQ